MKSLVVGLVLAVVPPTPATVDEYLSSALESTGLPGVSVVVTHGDRVVHATGAGQDSLNRPVTANTPMRVASVSKSFTAAAVMTLVSSGRLDLDAPVASVLPFPRDVTVRQLLNQTSGITDSSVDIDRLTSARSLAEYVSLLAPVTPTAAPGTKWAYSNVNYDVAARVVEVVSGQPFAEYVRSAVFEPLEMHDSSVGGWAADGHNALFGMWFSRPELDDGPLVNGSGAVVTTAADMGRWLIAQTGNGPLPMVHTTHEPSTVDDYGMGWAPDDNGLLVHSGNLWTYNAIQAIDPKTGYGYAVMTNGAGMVDETGTILAGLVALTRGETPETPGGSRQLTEWALAALTLLAAALGTLGVARSRRWATRRRHAPASAAVLDPAAAPANSQNFARNRPQDVTAAPTRSPGFRRSRIGVGLAALAERARTGGRGGRRQQLWGPEWASSRRRGLSIRDVSGRARTALGNPGRCAPNHEMSVDPLVVDPSKCDPDAAPTHSRGRPALPVYRYPPTGGPESILVVDNSSVVDKRGRAIWTGVRLVTCLLPGLLFVFYPQVVSVISAGRTVLWAQLFYFALPLTVALAAAALAGLAVFVARVLRLRSVA